MKRILLFLFVSIPLFLFAQVTITMEQDGGVYKVPCVVNGAKMKFIFDTGAASVCLSESMAEYLLDNDYISKDDIIGLGASQVADGRIVDHVKINLKDVEIAGLHLKDVEAVVVEGQRVPLLLGQTAIQRLGKVSIVGNELIIENGYEDNCIINNINIGKISFVVLKNKARNSEDDKKGIYSWVLAECYRMGICAPGDKKEAAYWYSVAAQRGNHDAETAYGDCFYEGEGITQDYSRAVYWYEQAAKYNHARALYCLGWCYGHGQGVQKNIDKGFALTVKAATSQVGSFYEENNIFAREELKNYFNKYYNIASNNGNGAACFYLALCYDNGYGINVDKQQALYWYTKGAEKGDYESMNNLGLLYERGEGGIKKDMYTAMYWYKMSAKEDRIGIAQRNLGKRYFYATSEIKQDLVESFYWFKQAADNGDYVSQKWVADFYRYGWGIEKNASYAIEKYVNLYRTLSKVLNSSCEQEDELLLTYNQVCCILGQMYRLGEGCEKNDETSFQWYLECHDYGTAYYFIYLSYLNGEGVEKDTQKAIQFLLKNRTAKWKDADGLNSLAYEYAEGGSGIKKSLELAHEVIDEAIELVPNDPNYYDTKGELYSMQKDYLNAKKMWDKVNSIDSSYFKKNNTELNKYIVNQQGK